MTPRFSRQDARLVTGSRLPRHSIGASGSARSALPRERVRSLALFGPRAMSDLDPNCAESRCDAVALGSSISVAAPFVRRCLTGSTMAPFSHPAHRTGQADLSGSSAIAGFRPTEPTVRRYRSGLFRKDLRRVDHRRHAWWITGSGRGKAIRSWR